MAKLELTPRLAENLGVEGSQARSVYFDTHRSAPRGFCLRVTAKGGRAFYLVATSKSTGRTWVRIGDARTVGLDAARKAAKVHAGELAAGRDVNGLAKAARTQARTERLREAADRNEWSVVDMLEAYVRTRRESLSPTTAAEYERMVARDVAPSDLGSLPARDVLKDDVRNVIREIASGRGRPKGKGPAPSLAARLLAFLRAAFRWGMDEEIRYAADDGTRGRRPRIDRDPTRGIEHELPKVRAAGRFRRKRHLSDAEIVVFWKGLEQLKPCWSAFARIILLCGTRRGETYAARWSDMELEGPAPVWRIPAAVRKGREAGSPGERRELVVPLAPLAVELIKELRPRTGNRPRVFVGDGIYAGGVGGEVKRVTGLSDVSVHDLRRSTASGLQRIGAPPHIISIVLGHSREAGATATDAAYAHDRRPDEHRAWLERWARHVEALVTGKRRAGADVVSITA